ncbi:NosD domain-containing protein [Cellulomonas humilata]|uniref:Periplasmic copper-binding protein NosD beta helix domain-containing protein n=1 Tax=Cellulomonas humilata TaxID=144055 RepID=A0ABU0EIQ2_9CELL|nr:NosD domain-containing protein [Cellulomonas humilata]MDQ0375077.1 hypothetical protein [Cellulomonas humilata]
MRLVARSVLTALLAAAVLSVGIAPAHASPPPGPAVRCGDVVTGDRHLARNLTCPGVAFTVVPPATLDLRGHTLRGGDVAFAVQATGMDTFPFVVRNGRITGFGTVVENAPDAFAWNVTLAGLRIDRNATVARGNDWGGPVVVDGSTVADNTTVFDMERFADLNVMRSRLVRNDVVISSISDGGRAAFTDSTLVDNRRLSGFVGVANLTLLRNTIKGSEEVVSPWWWVFASVEDNTFVDNGVAVSLGSHPGNVRRNTFRGNGVGIAAAAPGGGIWDGPAEIVGNTLTRNGDGIVTEDGAVVSVGDNRALRNSGWGIFVPGATDLGGNVAKGNGLEPQCTGVVCGPTRS